MFCGLKAQDQQYWPGNSNFHHLRVGQAKRTSPAWTVHIMTQTVRVPSIWHADYTNLTHGWDKSVISQRLCEEHTAGGKLWGAYCRW